MGGGEDYIFIVDVGDIEEEPTACKKFDLVVDDFLERELDDPVVYSIQVYIFEAGVFVIIPLEVPSDEPSPGAPSAAVRGVKRSPVEGIPRSRDAGPRRLYQDD